MMTEFNAMTPKTVGQINVMDFMCENECIIAIIKLNWRVWFLIEIVKKMHFECFDKLLSMVKSFSQPQHLHNHFHEIYAKLIQIVDCNLTLKMIKYYADLCFLITHSLNSKSLQWTLWNVILASMCKCSEIWRLYQYIVIIHPFISMEYFHMFGVFYWFGCIAICVANWTYFTCVFCS